MEYFPCEYVGWLPCSCRNCYIPFRNLALRAKPSVDILLIFYSHFCHLFCKELHFLSYFQSIWFKKWWVSRVTEEFHPWLHSLKAAVRPISLEMPIWGKTNTGLCFSFSKNSTWHLGSGTFLPVWFPTVLQEFYSHSGMDFKLLICRPIMTITGYNIWRYTFDFF